MDSVTTYSLKPGFQRLLQPLAYWMAGANLTANEVTLSTCALSVAAGTLITANGSAVRWFLILPPVLFARMALNALDGIMARDCGQRSDVGAYLNELSDVVSDAILMLPFARISEIGGFWVATAIGLAMLSEMAGLIGAAIGAGRRYDGPMGKSDRALVLGAFAIWIGLGLPVSQLVGNLAAALMSILISVTIYNRVRSGLAEVKGIEN